MKTLNDMISSRPAESQHRINKMAKEMIHVQDLDKYMITTNPDSAETPESDYFHHRPPNTNSE